MTTINPRATIGGNLPPTSSELLAEVLLALPATLIETNGALIKRAQELAEAAQRMPSEFTEQGHADNCTNFIKLIQACGKVSEETRKKAKEPFLQAGREVDGFFNPITEGLRTLQAAVTKPLDAWVKKRRDEERAEVAAAQARADTESKRRLEQAAALESAGLADEAAKKLAGAVKMEDRAEKLEQQVATGTGLGSSRTMEGAHAGLSSTWKGRWVDSNQPTSAELVALWRYVPTAARETALNGLVRDYAAALKIVPGTPVPVVTGAVIEQIESTRVR